METLKQDPLERIKSVFKELAMIEDIASLSKEERMKYDESIKVFRDQLATISFAEEKGKKEGRIEERREMARKSKELGLSIDIISQASGLTVEEIESL